MTPIPSPLEFAFCLAFGPVCALVLILVEGWVSAKRMERNSKGGSDG